MATVLPFGVATNFRRTSIGSTIPFSREAGQLSSHQTHHSAFGTFEVDGLGKLKTWRGRECVH